MGRGAAGWVGSPAPRRSILGGGIAGLATGYYARRRGIPFALYEAEDDVRAVDAYLARFENLRSSGRGACFEYTRMHALLRRAKDLVEA